MLEGRWASSRVPPLDGEEILACDAIGATPHAPKPLTSNAKTAGRFGKDDFVYLADQNALSVPSGREPLVATHAP
jgi:hypothetical protein